MVARTESKTRASKAMPANPLSASGQYISEALNIHRDSTNGLFGDLTDRRPSEKYPQTGLRGDPERNGILTSPKPTSGQRLIGNQGRCRLGGRALPPGFEDHTVCSEPIRKFSILLDSLTTSQICVLVRSD